MTAPTTTPTGRQPFLQGSIIWRKVYGVPVWAAALVLVAVLVLVVSWRRARATTAVGLQSVGAPPIEGYPAPIVNVPPPVVQVIPTTPPNVPPAGGATQPTVPTPLGKYVDVATYTSSNPPWNSTLSGIYRHYAGQTTASSWEQIWQHPLNNALRALRGAPERIRPGDKIFVPGVQ